jgi:undecaprenyl-diphosphatase
MKNKLLPIALLILFVALGELVLVQSPTLLQFDALTATAINETQTSLGTTIFSTITKIGNPISAFIICIIIAIILLIQKRRKDIGLVATTMIIGIGLVEIIKMLVERARPIEGLIPEDGWSFPSAHATFAAILMVILYNLFISKISKTKRWIYGTILMIISLGIAYSRIYLGVHWTSDVIAGLLLGFSISLFIDVIFEKISNRG